VEVGAPTLLVPRGAEERAVRRAAPHARIVGIRAGAAAARFLPEHLDGPLVLLGLCGALGPLPVGTVVTCELVADDAGLIVLGKVPAVLDARRGRAVTTAHVVTRASEKRALAHTSGADVVEMEGTHLARALALRGFGLAMVRVVSDGNATDLPPLEHAFDADGNVRAGAVALALASDPLAAARFVAEVRAALRVLGGVARTLAGI
jgi:hypothetical protein